MHIILIKTLCLKNNKFQLFKTPFTAIFYANNMQIYYRFNLIHQQIILSSPVATNYHSS